MLKKSNKFSDITCLGILLLIGMIGLKEPFIVTAESATEEPVFMDLGRISMRFEEGQLELPTSFEEELLLYRWIGEAVDQYTTEKGIEDVFYCDLQHDLLYGSREFSVRGIWAGKTTGYEYPLQAADTIVSERERYQLRLEGREHILYVEVNRREGKVILYPKEDVFPDLYESGNPDAYKQIVSVDGRWPVLEYPDWYVENDWDDMERADNHLDEVKQEELEHLDYLKLPENAADGYEVIIYLDVASVLKRYIEENQLEEVFYFDAEKDIVSHVTNMIFTCRVRSQNRTLYIDMDGYNLKYHVYQIEQ